MDTTGMEDLNIAMKETNLFEALSKRLVYSWCNRQDSPPTLKRIDHALINEHWAQLLPNAFSELLKPL